MDEEYKLSFTSGALLLKESSVAIDIYIEERNWKIVKEKIKTDNLLQARVKSSSVRIIRETINRLKLLNEKQLFFYSNASLRDRKALLWYAICKYYSYISEFAVEVIREKYLTMDYFLSDDDYRVFYNKKAEWHPELDQLKITTQNKIKQVLFRMLREAEIIDSNNNILASILSAEFIALLKEDGKGVFSVFPVPENFL